ncbi:circularly permuted type 2 ATP-grasp protein [Methylovirgula sp. 4M-Z18]|uniref:circularly permuted type 2 ATP-grasp protein n=1 Tax=Methylovirgula sp. 4M-Z18 TaxID=2293567 RepID=UPI000E2FE410|nr:circularly permuted type 2 ATP-grasp protein [Methylovirgula sp. 4M-Z18]RFB75691.1 hypothetical protein DYH55_21910 [Methylovirgula sp. 4M-Z18]
MQNSQSVATSLPPADTDGIDGLIQNYAPLSGIYDEMLDAHGAVRPHWQAFLASLAAMGPDEVGRRFGAADRNLRDSGVFYRVYDDPAGAERVWPLSHIPLLLGEQEWHALERGLVQRAALIESLLSDAYGPSHLVHDGVVPAAVIAGSPEFLHPMVGVTPVSGSHLHLYAVDIGRGPDGRWWVLNDRTQAPSGAGYALENRLAMSRALPDIYRGLRVERLAGFFQAFRGALASHSRSSEARICVLSPGQMNETYFEHAYLARYLGFLLVEGEDLTVRGDEVFVRTVAGLKPAEVIWRRLDADFSDPLELNAQSRLGVPGLVAALRSGSVLLANALGAGLAESRSLMSFMPAISQRLLGKNLDLPNIATWWCGQKRERDYVLANLDNLAIAPAFARALPGILGQGARLVSDLTAPERKTLLEAIAKRGIDFVAQEAVKLSTLPVWVNGQLEPRPFLLRLFVARTETGWQVMPGGFCRVSDSTNTSAVSMQTGGKSADVWVLSDKPVPETTLLPSPEGVQIRRQPGALPSRTADNLFWLGRYVERAEAVLRLLRALLARMTESTGSGADVIKRLVDLLIDWDSMSAETATQSPALIAGVCLHKAEGTGSLPMLLRAARGAASVIRDRFSPEAWRSLNNLVALLDNPALAEASGAEAFERINQALQIIAAFAGLAQENMNRLNGWRFLDIGRRMERAIATCRFVRQFAAPDAPVEALDTLLELGDSQITYRLRYVMVAARAPVIDLLMLDTNNPRSAAFQVANIEKHLARLPHVAHDGLPTAAERVIVRLAADLTVTEAEKVSIKQVYDIEQALLRVSSEISLNYFTHRERPVAPNESMA